MKFFFFLYLICSFFSIKSSDTDNDSEIETYNSMLNAIDNFDSDAVVNILFQEKEISYSCLNKALLYASGRRHTDNFAQTRAIITELILAGADPNYQEEENLDSFLMLLVKNRYTKPILIDTTRELGRPFLMLKNKRGETAARIALRLKRMDLLSRLSA